MRQSRHEMNREEKRREGLRLKVARQLPHEEVDDLDLPHLESKKEIADSIARAHTQTPRATAKAEALKFEETAEGFVVDEVTHPIDESAERILDSVR